MKIIMKKYIEIKKVVFCGLLLFVATNCEDQLDEINPSAITQESYFTSVSQAEAAINGIYAALFSFNKNKKVGFEYGTGSYVTLEMLSGHGSTLGQSKANQTLIDHTAASDEVQFAELWVAFYEGIANANFAINGIPNVEMVESSKNALLGEAYFLRALYYYYLVRLYVNIPLITSTIDFSSEDLYPSQSTTQEVYDLIVSDLQTAEQSGLPNVDNTGRASLGAVKSLLASVYLTMAGSPLNRGAEYYTLAASKSKEVLDWYVLFNDYGALHDRANKNSGEFIFQVNYKFGTQDGGIGGYVTPDMSQISATGSEIGALVPIPEFVASYEPGDKRAMEKEFFFTEYPKASNPGQTVQFLPHLWKFWLVEALGVDGDEKPDLNWTILRLPEVILIHAEASNEANGPSQYAYDKVNLIRTRAELPDLAGLSKEDFKKAIWRERYHELAYENKSYFDIQRTRKVYNLATGDFENAIGYKNESFTTFTEKYMSWPIPLMEISANPNLIQNTGW